MARSHHHALQLTGVPLLTDTFQWTVVLLLTTISQLINAPQIPIDWMTGRHTTAMHNPQKCPIHTKLPQ